MIIDTHAHLYYDELLNQIGDVIKRAEDAGIEKIIVPAVDYASTLTILELADKYKMIYGLAGVHPTEVQKVDNDELDKIYKLLDNEKIVGIGETGLDYYWDKTYIEKQKDFLRKQIEIAKDKNLPIVLHTRDSVADTISIIKENLDESLKGQFHCFGGTVNEMNEVTGLNSFYVSYCGNVTYKNFKERDVVSATPLEKLLSETDSPFLTPVPNRGKKNEPSNIVYTIKALSEIKNISENEMKSALYTNANELFFKNGNKI
ncbi:MAG TPA: TatD family hydrolase [Ignavibacteria bacterium]|nr:TatD family hydrolase [Ignavibacteria bacterium]